MRAQGATEYLIFLAVVLIIAVATTALLGFFPGTAPDAMISESRAYWRGAAAPFRIIDASTLPVAPGSACGSYGSGYEITVENAGNVPGSITGISMGGASAEFCQKGTSPGQPVTIQPGERATLDLGFAGGVNYSEGELVEKEVAIQYASQYLSGSLQKGEKRLDFRATDSAMCNGGGTACTLCIQNGGECSNGGCCNGPCSLLSSPPVCAAGTGDGSVCGYNYQFCATGSCNTWRGVCMQCRADGSPCDSDLDCCSKVCGSGACVDSQPGRTSCGVVVQEGGDYYLQMDWFDSGSQVHLSLVSPHQQEIGTFAGYYPPMPPAISLGHLNAGDPIVLSWMTVWWGTWGPFYSNNAGECYQSGPGTTSWTFTFDDGIHYGSGSERDNDFSLTIYKG